MHYFAFLVINSNASSKLPPLAYASCWINNSNRDSAYLQAERIITEQGWQIETTLEDHNVNESNYSAGDEGLQYYEQALTDNEVIVIFYSPDQ